MNYVDDRTVAICTACGDVLPDEPGNDPTFAACDSCHAESEAKAEAARYAEAVDDFRWFSRDWLKCHQCGGTGDREEYGVCGCHKGTELSDAMLAEFAFVRDLPARAVFSPCHMLENDIDPDERIVK